MFCQILLPIEIVLVSLLVDVCQGAGLHRGDATRHLPSHHPIAFEDMLRDISAAMSATGHPRPAAVVPLLLLQLAESLFALLLQRLAIVETGNVLQLFHLAQPRPQPWGLVKQGLPDVLVAQQGAVGLSGCLIISKHSLVGTVFQLRELLGNSLAYRVHIIAVEEIDIRRIAALLHEGQRLDGQPNGIGRILHREAHRLCSRRSGERHCVLLRPFAVHIHAHRLRHRLTVGQQRQRTLLAVAMLCCRGDILIRGHRAAHGDGDRKLHRHRTTSGNCY